MTNNRYRLAWLSARRRAALASKAFFAEASAARELEAAVVEMQPASSASRERMIKVLGGSELAAATVDHLLAAGVFRDEAQVKAEARQETAQSIRDEAVDEAVDGFLSLTAVLRICEEAGR